MTDPKRPLLPSISALSLLPEIVNAPGPLCRGDLVELTGLSRVTVGQRLAELFEAGIICEGDEMVSSGGRPRRPILLNAAAALIGAADIGETHLHIAITDLGPQVLAEVTLPFQMTQGPEATLTAIAEGVRGLLAGLERRVRDLVGIGLSLPAPVNFRAGTVVGPSVMLGWDDFDIRGFLGGLIPVPVLVDNDVNLLALAQVEARAETSIVFVKLGTGIGCGIISDRRVFRGANGAAGDIGHIQLEGDRLCRCGKTGCVEAHAAGWALARDLRAAGFQAQTARDVVDLVRQGHPDAVQVLRQGARVIGQVLADLVAILNPDRIIIGGMMALVSDHLLSGVREMVYSRCLPLATRDMEISVSAHDPQAGVRGAALIVKEWAFAAPNTRATVRRLFDTLHPKPAKRDMD